jgi:hypothetical protein
MQGIASKSGSNSVYGELKLSEKLHAELDLVRNEVDKVREELEEIKYKNECLEIEAKELTLKYLNK